jgi:hypothetical protein
MGGGGGGLVGCRIDLDIFEKTKSVVPAGKWFHPVNMKYDYLNYENYCIV